MSRIKRELVRLGQADGSEVALVAQGDEFYARLETEDGLTAVFDTTLGKFCYARLIHGEFVSTGIDVCKKPPTGLRRHLRENGIVIGRKFHRRRMFAEVPSSSGPPVPTEATFGAANGLLPGRRISTGQVRGVTILVQFQDVQCEWTPQQISSLLNDDSYGGNNNHCSVREYFLRLSNNNLEYSNEVIGPVKLSKRRADYHYTPRNELLLEALEALRTSGANLEHFDANGDGIIDAINILYAGQTQYVDRSWLWPHNFYHEQDLGPCRTYFYQVCSMASLSIGTICHENGHMLCRFPDLYDYGTRDNDFARSSGLGQYCLMSSGNHLANGKTPSPICGFLRELAGWTRRIRLSPGTYSIEHANYGDLHALELPDAPSEYFVIENRHRTGLDSALSSDGLAVFHCDIFGSNEWQQGSPSKHYQCALLQADGRMDLERGLNQGDSGDLFSATKETVLSYNTIPKFCRWDRSSTGFAISNISTPADSIAFTIETH